MWNNIVFLRLVLYFKKTLQKVSPTINSSKITLLFSIFRWKKLVFVLASVFIFSNGYSQEENSLDNTLEWEAVKFSKGYNVQIRNKGKKLIIDEKVSENKYTIKLAEGFYEHRIGVYNKFGKVSAYSEWESFQIKKVTDPEVTTKQLEILNDGNQKEISIKGNYFTPDTLVVLRMNEDKLRIDNIKIINEREIELQISPDKNFIGNFDLILINPRNKKVVIKDFLNLNKPVEMSRVEETKSERIAGIDTEKPANYKIKNALRSAVLPGWGQFHEGNKLKGIVFTTIFFGGAIYLGSKYNDYKKSKEAYESETNQGLLLGSYTGQGAGALVLYNYTSSTANYSNTLDKANHISQVGIGLQIFYLYNIIDNFLVSDKDLSPKPGLSFFSDHKLQVYAPGLPLNNQIDVGLKFNF